MAQLDAAAADPRRTVAAGLMAGAVTVLIWSLWVVAVRGAATVHIPPPWLGLVRFVVPAVLLVPFWWKHGLLPKGVGLGTLALMVAGSGAPYFLLVAAGMAHASAAESGVLLGGTTPLVAAAMTAVVERERFGVSRLVGFALVIAAMAAIGGPALVTGEGVGRFLIVGGAVLWAGYTLAYRRSGLPPLAAAGIIAVWSSVVLIPFAVFADPAPLVADTTVFVGELLTQGILVGIVALTGYGIAVRNLGASRGALIAAMPPAFAALLAIPILGETPSLLVLLGVVLTVVGVALASGALAFGRRRGGPIAPASESRRAG
jgi:drug/metabolite transporter (DMT)-like permease